jgi:hypothetical protein
MLPAQPGVFIDGEKVRKKPPVLKEGDGWLGWVG